ncbi:MAG: hypothetical protein ABSF48_11590 [Thermodesulfobacteriota bacterium]|jgi:hypothetical protein
MQNFNPANLAALAVSNMLGDYGSSTSIPQSLGDQKSNFLISTLTAPTREPVALPSAGYEVGGGKVWGQTKYIARNNTNCNTTILIQIGIGYGLVDFTALYGEMKSTKRNLIGGSHV